MDEIIVTPSQMKMLEKNSEKKVSLFDLMKNAGRKLSETVLKEAAPKAKLLFLCGSGNNGGDGFVCASILAKKDYNIEIILCCGKPKTELSKKAFEMLPKKANIISMFDDIQIQSDSIIIDCVFGTGFHGEISDEKISKLFDKVNESPCQIISCDIVSGGNSLNGLCSPHTLSADVTVTFGAIKSGMLFSPCKDNCGKIIEADIGITQSAYDSIDNYTTRLNKKYIKSLIPKRKPDSNKGTYGKLINVAGSGNYIGAAGLSTLAALRCGVGLCALATTQNIINNISSRILEAIYIPLESDTQKDSQTILENAKSASAILIGCGLGNSSNTLKLLDEIILNANCPIIIDADGINALSTSINILRKAKSSIILTPHPKEFSRLIKTPVEEILENKLELSENFAKEYGITLVLKGAGTIIATKDKTFISTKGNSGLSRGGSGDVLAGMIASFVAQGLNAEHSACVGTFLHGLCADRVAQKTSMRGMLPSDIIEELPLLFHDLMR